MKSVAVLYATREGQTGKIADRVAADLRAQGFEAISWDVRKKSAALDLSPCSAAVLAASVHLGRHEREMVKFVRKHRAELDRLPNAFLSITLSEAGVERPGQPQKIREQCKAGVMEVIDRFVRATGWQPKHVKAIAGALPYTQYNPVVRLVLKRIARSAGGDTDTSRDYEYTDWDALDQFVGEIAQEFR